MGMALRYAAAWTGAMAALMLPLSVVAGTLHQAGMRPPFALLCGFAASTVALWGAGYLMMLIEEKTTFKVIPRDNIDLSLFSLLFCIALSVAGSWVVAFFAKAFL